MDGGFFSVSDQQVEPAVLSTVDMLSSVPEFIEFKARTLGPRPSATELQLHAPGLKYPLVCMGVGQEAGRDAHTRVGEAGEVKQRQFKYNRYVGDHGEKEEEARKQEAIEKGLATAEEWDREERLFPLYHEQSAGGNGPFVAAAIGVIVLGYFFLA